MQSSFVCPSVISVTIWCSTETAKRWIMQTTLHDNRPETRRFLLRKLESLGYRVHSDAKNVGEIPTRSPPADTMTA